MLEEPIQYLRRGSQGDYVRVVQKILNLYLAKGMTPLVPDGIFGPNTEAAVKFFQSRHKLVPDGIVGPLTRGKLFPLGTYHGLCFMTSPSQDDGGERASFRLTGDQPRRVGSPVLVPPIIPPPVINLSPFTTSPLSAMQLGNPLITDDLPGMPDPFPFPDLLPFLPSIPTLPSLPSVSLPNVFPNKLQLAAGVQRSVPKLTLSGPPPKSNPVVDTFVFTVRGSWDVGRGQFQAGGTLGLPLSKPISDPKNTTYQAFIQGVTGDLLIKYKSWVHLFILGKASVTVPKDGSSTAVAFSPQFKAGFDIIKPKDKTKSSLSFSVTGGPQITATNSNTGLSVTLTPFAATAGVTLSTPLF